MFWSQMSGKMKRNGIEFEYILLAQNESRQEVVFCGLIIICGYYCVFQSQFSNIYVNCMVVEN